MEDITDFLVYHKDQYCSLTLAKIHTGEYSVFYKLDSEECEECQECEKSEECVIDVLFEGSKEKCIDFVYNELRKFTNK